MTARRDGSFSALHRHMHDAGDFRRAALAGDGIFNRRFLHAEMLADQRRKGRDRTALGTAEDSAERRGLLFIGALIDVGCVTPKPRLGG